MSADLALTLFDLCVAIAVVLWSGTLVTAWGTGQLDRYELSWPAEINPTEINSLEQKNMNITLPMLPYPDDALEPHISRMTLEIHHGKHHRAYVEKAKALAKEVRLDDQPLERIIQITAGEERHRALFNNAAQAWNHAFYWRSLMPNGGGAPTGEIGKQIETDFGGYETFVKQMEAAAVGQFGSGWAWLVLDGGRLRVTTTSNADTPLAHGQTPLLGIDVWEHSYYLDYQNRRADYAAGVIEHLINWDFANRNLSRRNASASLLQPLVDRARASTGR